MKIDHWWRSRVCGSWRMKPEFQCAQKQTWSRRQLHLCMILTIIHCRCIYQYKFVFQSHLPKSLNWNKFKIWQVFTGGLKSTSNNIKIWNKVPVIFLPFPELLPHNPCWQAVWVITVSTACNWCLLWFVEESWYFCPQKLSLCCKVLQSFWHYRHVDTINMEFYCFLFFLQEKLT